MSRQSTYGLPPRAELMKAVVEHAAAIALHAMAVRIPDDDLTSAAEEQLEQTGPALVKLLDQIYGESS